MPTSVRKMDQLLVNELGFTRRTGRHQIYVLELGGRQVVRTLISHGAREISDDLLSTMAQQMGVRTPELKKLLAGELSRAAYLDILHERGIA
ncbi:MAG: hypothetical protein U5R49_07060 [Deltaproteobacteria bacterium]|nr:hypothetical protein [Deltaproteobacteria bacterium]